MQLEMRGLTKRFGSFTANDSIDLTIEPGEIHCLLGENGAGKSTLMNMLYGLLEPTEGGIFLDGEPAGFQSPADAIAAGIGMVHQHFMLVPVFTVAENVMLGREQLKSLGRLDRKAAAERVRELSSTYKLKVAPEPLVESLPVGVQQRVEILKALANDAKVLILDEPTAVLTPQETDELMEIMRSLKERGTSIIFITHKLREVKAIGDKITVIRRGKVVGTAPPTASEAELAEMMVGRAVKLVVDKDAAEPGDDVLSVAGVTVIDSRGATVVDDVSFTAKAGEVLAIAGVQGNGQTELIKTLMGLIEPTAGTISLDGEDISDYDPRRSLEAGIGYIPEDRAHDGYVGSFGVDENLVLDRVRDPEFSRAGSCSSTRSRRTRATGSASSTSAPRPPELPELALRRQPAEGRRRPRDVPPAAGADRLAAHPRRRRRLHRVHPQADHRGARPRHRRDHRLHRARRGLRPRRPDRGDVRRPHRRHRLARHRARGDRPADGRRCPCLR